MMKIAIVCGKKIFYVFLEYTPQQGRPDEEKREFLEKLSDNIQDVPQEDLLMAARDINCHNDSRSTAECKFQLH